MKMVASLLPASQLYKMCYLVFDTGPTGHKLLGQFRDVDNSHEFAKGKTGELGHECLVCEASVGSHVKLVDES